MHKRSPECLVIELSIMGGYHSKCLFAIGTDAGCISKKEDVGHAERIRIRGLGYQLPSNQ